MSEFKKQREYLHDLSNKLTVSQGFLRKSFKSLDIESLPSDTKKELETVDSYLKEAVFLIKEFRNYLHSEENKDIS